MPMSGIQSLSLFRSKLDYLLRSHLRQTGRLAAPFSASRISKTSITTLRPFTTTRMKFTTPSLDPPKHEMAFFPNMTTSLPSESGEFRRVLWTGLYSQLVLMTVPVDGEIGDEVRRVFLLQSFSLTSVIS